MRKTNKIVTLFLVAAMVLGTLSGCGTGKASTKEDGTATTSQESSASTGESSEANATSEANKENPWGDLDLSEYEEVNCYVVGNTGDDWQKVVDKANELMIQKINTKVNFTIVPWSDFQTKYSLYLAGDEDVDMIYCASWCNYSDYVKSGAYKPMDWDFIQKYMPLTAEKQAKASWKEVSYDGSYYCIPSDWAGIAAGGIVTTQQILDKYGYKKEDIKNIDDLSKFLHSIAASDNNDGMYAISTQGSYPTDGTWFSGKNHMMDINAGTATWMVWRYNTGKDFSVDDMDWFGYTDEYKNYALEMADYYASGIFPSNIISSDSFIDDNFLQGKSAIDMVGPETANSLKKQLKEQGKDLVYLDCTFDDESVTRRGNYMGYGTAFPVASKKTERAAVALDCMKFDDEVNRLLLGGFEGEHYTYDEATNTRELGTNATAYPWGSWYIMLQHDNDPQLKLDDEFDIARKRYEDAEVPSETFPVNGFTYDGSKYETEIATINSIVNEYRFSFGFGIYGDQTEEKLNQFIEECKAAGIDDIIADIKAQLTAYINQ